MGHTRSTTVECLSSLYAFLAEDGHGKGQIVGYYPSIRETKTVVVDKDFNEISAAATCKNTAVCISLH